MKQQATSWYLLKSIAVKPPLTTDTTFGKELIKIFYGDDKARNTVTKQLFHFILSLHSSFIPDRGRISLKKNLGKVLNRHGN